MLRAEVKNEYKWQLEDIVATDDEWQTLFAELDAAIPSIAQYKGKLGDENAALACLRLSDELDIKLEKLYAYAHMRRDENGAVDKYKGLCDKIDGLSVKYSTLSSFISPELSAQSDEYLNGLIANEAFSAYDYSLTQLLRRKKYILSEKEEKILAMSASATSMFEDVFGQLDYVDLPLPKITVDGEDVQLTQGKYSLLLQHSDVAVRKAAFDGLYETYKKLINTITAIYAGSVKSDNFYAEARGYDDALTKAMYVDNVPTTVYNQLLAAVSDNLSAVHDYVELRRKSLGGELHMYDMYVPITEGVEKNYDYETAFSMVLDGLAPMGEEYLSLLKQAKAQRWIDVYETENKRTGAYSWGCYGVHPFVLLNHSGTTHDVFTIAHELGHSLHSHYSSHAQPYSKAHYSIFVAEVASTVNEVLLLKHMIAAATDDKQKEYLLAYYLDMFRTTLFRQTMFAEFEKISHDMAASGQPLTPDSLSNEYYALNKKYYGDSVIHDDYIRYEWARIPHFYNSFYVYKYATGITAAVNIANAILSDDENGTNKAKYKKFLSSGSTDSPYELLKITGVDLATKQPFDVAMGEFAAALSQLKQLKGNK